LQEVIPPSLLDRLLLLINNPDQVAKRAAPTWVWIAQWLSTFAPQG
jgi:hypothetical protein